MEFQLATARKSCNLFDGTVIMVTQMCKKSKNVTCTVKHVWTRCGNNGKSQAEKRKMKKRPLCQKWTRKSGVKEKIVQKKRTTKTRRKRPVE